MAWKPSLSLSPSAASRWLVCQGSPQYILDNNDRIPKDATVFNVEGGQAHAVAEAIIRKDKVPTWTKKEGKIDKAKLPEMVRYGKGFRRYLFEEPPVEWWTEKKIDLFYMPGRSGYVDFIGLYRNRVRIVDYKYGQGVAVSAEENEQMAIYARSLIDSELVDDIFWSIKDDTVIEMIIYQPRTRDGDIESVWSLTWKELRDYTDKIGTTAKRIINAKGKLEFRPSNETCQFCPAKTFCKAREQQRSDESLALLPDLSEEDDVPETLKLPDPSTISTKTILAALRHRSAIKKWLDEVYKMHYASSLKGGATEGFKLVAGKGSRGWVNEDEVEELLLDYLDEDVVRPGKLLSPNQAENALREVGASKKTISKLLDFVESFAGKPTLVHESDKRKALSGDPLDYLSNLDEDDTEIYDDLF